ncbi:unnamed protein product [Orchesella dallaii]|uniref:Uncharacterized protein n=1 Tax=Orchesella dallaii TaxID=48710 RepID=A0ABP1QQ12_9HEXA
MYKYSSNFVWHDQDAYCIAKPYVRRKLGESFNHNISWISNSQSVLVKPKPRKEQHHHQHNFRILPKDARQLKYGSAVRHFDFNKDARGLKSHFLPAIIETYVEPAINSFSKVQQVNNLYTSSVYAQDYTLSAIS